MAHQQGHWPNNEMGKLTFKKDWSKTPLGAMADWPQSLHSALYICLVSDKPASIYWGADFRFFYNDAWKNLFGAKYSESYGSPAREVFGQRWEMFNSYFEEVKTSGEVKKAVDTRFAVSNQEEQKITFSFTPIFNDSGAIEGIYTIAESSRSEKQFQQREQEYYDLFENAPIGFHLMGAEGTILKVNQAELDIVGYSRDEYVGRNITEFYVDDELIEGVLNRLQEGKEVDNIEGKMLHKDGSIREVALSANIPQDSEQQDHICCFIRDITELKRLTRKVGETEHRYRTLVENFPKGAVALFDENLRYIAVGGELVTQSGVEAKDRIGNKITDLYPDNIIDDIKKYFHHVFKGEANSFEAQFHNRHLFGQTLPIKSSKGNINSGMLVIQDITERWQAEQNLRESEAKFRMMAENLNEIIWMVSEEGEEIIYTNPAFENIWGINREKLYDDPKYFLDFVHPEDRDRILRLSSELPEQEFDDQFRIMRPDGEIRWLHTRGSKVFDEEGQITRIIGIAEDITNYKKAQKELEEINATLEERIAERTKELHSYQNQLRLLASQLNKAEERERQRLATELHDTLGQMLTVIKMKIEGIRPSSISDQSLHELEEVKNIVDDALKYSQNLMVELKPPPVLNKEDVTEVLYWIVRNMEKKGLDITVEDDGMPKPVEEELRTILHQSVRELLQNVIKHADTNQARMEISRENDHLKVVVEDKGKGFNLREKKPTPTKEGGFGLFNIRERMDWHGGTFKIHSEPGVGTKAVLCVPLEEEEKIEISQRDQEGILSREKSEKKSDQSQKIKVLLADDHEMVRRGLQQVIEKQEDISVIGEASNGQEAVDLARETSSDLVVMDVNMPVMDGIEATKIIKDEMPDVRVIGLSLHDSREVIQDMRRAGASDYLTKDEAFELLIATIRAEAAAQEN